MAVERPAGSRPLAPPLTAGVGQSRDLRHITTTRVGRAVVATLTRLGLAVAISVLAGSPTADAQTTGKIHRIGYLSSGSATSSAHFVEAFRQGLRELGWVEGRNIVIEYRFTEGRFDRLPDLAAELVRLKVDVIAAGPTPPALAAKNATGAIPIVMTVAAEPVELGLITEPRAPRRFNGPDARVARSSKSASFPSAVSVILFRAGLVHRQANFRMLALRAAADPGRSPYQ